MFSRRVDLTEHMDFSRGIIGSFSDIQLVEIPDDEHEFMTTEEYEWLTWWEGIFGRKGHRNQKHEIFNSKATLNELKAHCYRCGKPFRIPWDSIGGICRKCDGEIFDPSHTLPWKRNNDPSVSERSIVYNLFNSR